MNKFLKWFLICVFIIGLPIVIIVTVLYINDGFYLKKFNEWINQTGNLTALIAACMLYLPFVNAIWKTGLLISQSVRESTIKKELKNKNQIVIYEKNDNLIIWDEENSLINLKFKACQKSDIKFVLEQAVNEAKERVNFYVTNKKKKGV